MKKEGVGLNPTIAKLKEVKGVEGEIEKREIDGVKNKRRLEEFGLRLDGLKKEVVELVEGFAVEVV